MIRSLNFHNYLAKKQTWQVYAIYDSQQYTDNRMIEWLWDSSNSYREVQQDNLDDIHLCESISIKSSRSIKNLKKSSDEPSTNMTKRAPGLC